MKVSDVLTGLLFGVFGLAVLLYSQTFPHIPGQDFGPRAFPSIIGAGFMICAVLLVQQGLRKHPRDPWVKLAKEFSSSHATFRFWLVPIMVVLYLLFIDLIGFIILSALFLLFFFLAFGVRSTKAFLIAIVSSLVIFYIFYSLLHVPLPWGVLEPFAW
ncbi:tripartite tricarboxylate transporter TctB family protein [Castellaniella sp.]|uniref:tripartite tricarboxylate transporter TctB family protein n=1 Tax=Castellaniella sp. TaxID=1955812 RepID=UPI003568B16D